MSSVELNIIERGLKGQGWSAEKGPISSGDLDKIAEQRTNNSSALNALPTPFARFFVVREAFRRALEELKNPRKVAGDAYNRLVSDTLDVFELLYNLSFHSSRWGNSRKIHIREWEMETDLPELNRKTPVLGNAVRTYFNTDLADTGGRLFFVVLEDNGRDYLLGTSSPFTGFVTPPDLDKKEDGRGNGEMTFMGKRYRQMPSLIRKNNGVYFRDIRMFGARDKDFKNYMFHIMEQLPEDSVLKNLRDYVKQFEKTDPDIVKTWVPQLKSITSENSNELEINGLKVCKDSGIGTVNFFTDTLIKVPFRISDAYYRPMTFVNGDDNRDYDFLLPISRDALSVMAGDFECFCRVTASKVVVTLRHKGQEYTKDYYDESDVIGNRGRIVSLQKENLSMNIGVFPNILSPNPSENNYFKVMAVLSDATEEYRPVSVDQLDLRFYSRNSDLKLEEIHTIEADNRHAMFGVRPGVVRSKQENDKGIAAGSKFYEIFNTGFDAVGVSLKLANGVCEGLLLPKWRKAQRTTDSYTYAVDLGTTNTYISCRKIGKDYEPEQLSMDEPMVAYLHDFKRSTQLSLVSVIEKDLPPRCRRNFSTEFVPPLVDGISYRFPIRTALCVRKGDRSRPSLFDNCNIAFFYEKTMGLPNQSIMTDIKWEDSHEKELRIFIRELLLIIRTDLLQRNGHLAGTRLIWFRPLSFMGRIKDLYTTIWEEEARDILNIGPSQIECVSESEAPYYYFNKKNAFSSVDAVSIVDIGGGSSDFIYFRDGKPIIANSVHFGCDALWGNGFSGFENDRSNGIFRRMVDIIHLGDSSDELEQLNVEMKNDSVTSTKDIINFWLSNDDKCEISRELRKYYKPLFLYHFASLLYFMARMYKSKELPCPRSVLFCGNGSRYIDGLLSSDRQLIKKLVTTVFRSVYGETKDIQIILPESRKECTCYGGLYRESDIEVPDEFNFQGVSGKEYENVDRLKEGFETFSRKLLETFDDFHALYAELLKILIAGGALDSPVDMKEIKDVISSGIEDSLDKNFKTQVLQKLNGNEVYHDSVFFLPVIDNILKLTNI